jgi:arylformamidase
MDYEAEYNNRAKVPGFAPIVEGWYRDAAAFRGSHPYADLGVAYGPGERNALDIFWPSRERAGRMAIFVHGGYWQMQHRFGRAIWPQACWRMAWRWRCRPTICAPVSPWPR